MEWFHLGEPNDRAERAFERPRNCAGAGAATPRLRIVDNLLRRQSTQLLLRRLDLPTLGARALGGPLLLQLARRRQLLGAIVLARRRARSAACLPAPSP